MLKNGVSCVPLHGRPLDTNAQSGKNRSMPSRSWFMIKTLPFLQPVVYPGVCSFWKKDLQVVFDVTTKTRRVVLAISTQLAGPMSSNAILVEEFPHPSRTQLRSLGALNQTCRKASTGILPACINIWKSANARSRSQPLGTRQSSAH